MDIEKLIDTYPDIAKIDMVYFNKIINNYCSDIDTNLTWGQNGFDGLDLVEIIMELEKICDIIFNDELFDLIIGIDIVVNIMYDVLTFAKKLNRDKKINQVLKT
jgi:acyl carrier protein